jgi:hypothetical protein
MTSFTNGTFKSSWSVILGTYQGALAILRTIFDWLFWIMEILDLLAHPQISAPYVQIGFIIVL